MDRIVSQCETTSHIHEGAMTKGTSVVKAQKKLTAREEALMEVQVFIESPQVKEVVGKILMSRSQFITAARQWAMVCGEVEELFQQAEKLQEKIKKTASDKKFRIQRSQLPVTQLLSELNLPDDKASISKMRTIGRAVFLRKAEYENSLPAAKETLYITAQALGAGNSSTFNVTEAEQNFKKIISAEDYDTEAPRSKVTAIVNQVVGNVKKKKTQKSSMSDSQLVRRIIAFTRMTPEIRLTIPGDMKKKLNSVAKEMMDSKKLNDKDWNIWSSVVA